MYAVNTLQCCRQSYKQCSLKIQYKTLVLRVSEISNVGSIIMLTE